MAFDQGRTLLNDGPCDDDSLCSLCWVKRTIEIGHLFDILKSLNHPNFQNESRQGKQAVKDEDNGILFNSFRLRMPRMEQPICSDVPTLKSRVCVTLENCETLVGKTIEIVDVWDKAIEGENKSNKEEERDKEIPGDEPLEQRNQPHPNKEIKDEQHVSKSNLISKEPSATDQGHESNISIKKPISSEVDTGIESIDQKEEPVSSHVVEINKATEIDVRSERMASFPLNETSKDGGDQNIPIMDQLLESNKVIDRGDTTKSQFDRKKDENVKECSLELVDSKENLPPMTDRNKKLSYPDDLEKEKVANLSSTPSKVDPEDDKPNELTKLEPVPNQTAENNQDVKVGQEQGPKDDTKSESIIDLDERSIIESEPALQVQKSESEANEGNPPNSIGVESKTDSDPLSKGGIIQQDPELKGRQDQTTPTKKVSAIKKKVVKKKQRDEKRRTDRAEEGTETSPVKNGEADRQIDMEQNLVEPDTLEESNLNSPSHAEPSEPPRSSEQIIKESDPLPSTEAQEDLPDPASADVLDSRSYNPDHHLNESDHLTTTIEDENHRSAQEIKSGTLESQGREPQPRQRALVSSFESSQESIQNLLTTFRPQRRHEQLISTSFITYQEVISSNRNRNMNKLLVPAHPKSYLPVYF